MHDALEIAKYVINFCLNENKPISNLKLQKILYFLQAIFLVEKGESLFENKILAWQYGPVVPEVYYSFCMYGGGPIYNRYKTDLDDDENMREIIDKTIKNLMPVEPWELVERTHISGGPWDEIIKNKGERATIPTDLIKTYFMKHNEELPNEW